MQCSDNVCSSILNDGYGAGDGDGGEGSKHTSKFDKCVNKGHFRVVLGGFTEGPKVCLLCHRPNSPGSVEKSRLTYQVLSQEPSTF